MYIWYGIDIGGIKIELVVCDVMLVVQYCQCVVMLIQDYFVFLQVVDDLVMVVDVVFGWFGVVVGIGLFGVCDCDSGCQFSVNVLGLIGCIVGVDLQVCLQWLLVFGNDLQCFVLFEVYDGVVVGYCSMFGVIFGIGVGGGYCLDGYLVVGSNGIVGEWGYWSFLVMLQYCYDLLLLDCGCGLCGCLEWYVFGSGLVMIYVCCGGDDFDVSVVVVFVQIGDVVVQKVLVIYCDLFGYSFVSLILVLDLYVIVLGGGLLKLEQFYWDLFVVIVLYLFVGVCVFLILLLVFGDVGGVCGVVLFVCQYYFFF